MKFCRRRRPIRPRMSRAQLNQQLNRTRRLLNLFRAEWLLENQQDPPCPAHLRFVHDRIVDLNDEIASLERQ